MFTKFIKVVQLLLLLNCIFLASSHSLRVPSKLLKDFVSNKRQYRSADTFWPFSLFGGNAESTPSSFFVKKDDILTLVDLKKNSLWKVQNYQGIIVKSVDSINSTINHTSGEGDNATQKDAWHIFQIRDDQKPYYIKIDNDEISQVPDKDSAEANLTIPDPTISNAGNLSESIRNETESETGFFGYLMSTFRGNGSGPAEAVSTTEESTTTESTTVTTVSTESSGFFNWFGFGVKATTKPDEIQSTTTENPDETQSTTKKSDETQSTKKSDVSSSQSPPVSTKSFENVDSQSPENVDPQSPANITPQLPTSVKVEEEVRLKPTSQDTMNVTPPHNRPNEKMMRTSTQDVQNAHQNVSLKEQSANSHKNYRSLDTDFLPNSGDVMYSGQSKVRHSNAN